MHFAVIPGASRDSIGNETRHCVEVFKARGHMRGVINNHASRSSCRSQNAKYFRNKFLVALLRRAPTAQDPHIHGIPRNCSERYLDPQRGALDEACGGARAARRAGLDETQEERARQHMQQSATDKSGSSGAPHEFFWPKMPRELAAIALILPTTLFFRKELYSRLEFSLFRSARLVLRLSPA